MTQPLGAPPSHASVGDSAELRYRASMRYLEFLAAMHEKLSPATYLEIGVSRGYSLAMSRCRSVGIDPAFAIQAELNGDVALFRTSSDEYFSRPDPLSPTGGRPFEMVFIDGLHIFEFALRDFIHAEKYSSPRSVIIFDDVLPRSVDEAARVRHTGSWTGDVYPIMAVLARYRPGLTVIPVNTQPTGLLLVLGLDPHDTTLAANYRAILAEYRQRDPQPVPPELLDRLTVLAPQRVLDSDFWDVLSGAAPDASPGDVRAALAPRLAASLGSALGATSSPGHAA